MARYGSAGTVKGDPHWITVRFAGECAGCGTVLRQGERAFYWPKGRRLECDVCGETSDRRFQAEVQDEFMSGGW